MRSQQEGLGFFGLVVMLAAIATAVSIGIKVFPLYTNEAKLKRALTETAKRTDIASSLELRKALERWWAIDDIQFLNPTDVQLAGSPGKRRDMTYDYYARADLFEDISIIVHFKGDVPFGGSSN